MQNKSRKKQAFYMPKNVHKITHLQNFHTYIQILQNLKINIRHFVIEKRATSFFVPLFFPHHEHSTPCPSQTRKKGQKKKKKQDNNF